MSDTLSLIYVSSHDAPVNKIIFTAYEFLELISDFILSHVFL